MITVHGEYNKAVVYTDTADETTLKQIKDICGEKAFADAKIRIMPDCHAGSGCVIGFTATAPDKIVPNIVGVDIGCGMEVIELGKIDIDLPKLDAVLHAVVPTGVNKHPSVVNKSLDIYDLKFKPHNVEDIQCSLGTLGGGNHFIEIDVDNEGNKYFVVHTGSRNLGKQCADYYQKLAIKNMKEPDLTPLINCMKKLGLQSQISYVLSVIKAEKRIINPDLAYLTGTDMADYLHDARICQTYANANRWFIFDNVQKAMGWNYMKSWTSMHNYISKDNIVRKGAVSATAGEKLIIPLNMRDGALICEGLGNDDWNQSAPHGAGRIMSRRQANATISLDDYKEAMKGIYSSTVNANTLDEAPFAYKNASEIVDNIKDTATILKHITPLLNFKDDTERVTYGTIHKES